MSNEFSIHLPLKEETEIGMLPIQCAARAVHALTPGSRLVGMTKGQFSLIDLIQATVSKIGPAHLQLSTWTIGIADATQAAYLLTSGELLSVRLLVDKSFATRQPEYCAAVRHNFGDEAIRCTRTHAKVALLENDAWQVAIRGSMNLNKNRRYENFDIDADPEVFALFAAYFAEIADIMPAGPVVSVSEVNAIFERASRGMNVFDSRDEAYAISLGVPLHDAAGLRRWIDERLRENRKARKRPSAIRALARAVGLDYREYQQAMANPPTSLALDIVYALESK